MTAFLFMNRLYFILCALFVTIQTSAQEVITYFNATDLIRSEGETAALYSVKLTDNYTFVTIEATAYNVNCYNNTYTPGARTTTNTSYVHFFIDPNGNCYNVKTNHTKTVSKFAPGKTVFLGLGILAPIVGLIAGLAAVQ